MHYPKSLICCEWKIFSIFKAGCLTAALILMLYLNSVTKTVQDRSLRHPSKSVSHQEDSVRKDLKEISSPRLKAMHNNSNKKKAFETRRTKNKPTSNVTAKFERFENDSHGHGDTQKPYLLVQEPGRLGNRLFQFSSGFSIAKESNHTLIVQRKHALRSVFSPVRDYPEISFQARDFNHSGERAAGTFQPSLFHLPPLNEMICCYFQSWKYFAKHERELRKQFVFLDPIRNRSQHIIQDVAHQYRLRRMSVINITSTSERMFISNDLVFVGLHVRRRDTLGASAKASGYTSAPLSYINKALDYFRNKYTDAVFLVVSDDPTWSRQQLSTRHADVFLANGGTSAIDLCTLAHCNHTIITVGSFGWWGAWLANGDVVYYKDWPIKGSRLAEQYSPEDYFLPSWIGLTS